MIAEKDLKNKGRKGIPFCVQGQVTVERGSWRTFKPVVDRKKCIRCLTCFLFCPDSAIKIHNKGKDKGTPYVDSKVCKGCGVCANECPVKCIRMERDIKRGRK